MSTPFTVQLRTFKSGDAPNLVRIANNPKIAANLRDGFPHPYTYEHAEKFILMAMHDRKSKVFAIEWEGQHVGNVGLHRKDDIYRNTAEIGYFIGEDYWGKGIASLAVAQAVRYGFEEMDLMRIDAGVFDYNLGSMRVLEKCGFQKEGIARRAAVKLGKVLDEHRYAIVRG
ncbi:MAG: hypothetical protein A3D92_15035 [Bacteroidetes bacterium RIFCSPHIGHO2_02_FULL_44_7]|nr:MAG: hypothetical protein A3D92_15035 [Bacteroidetes bacterium RIFCSPHIGHO2_02_FULL_44_7]